MNFTLPDLGACSDLNKDQHGVSSGHPPASGRLRLWQPDAVLSMPALRPSYILLTEKIHVTCPMEGISVAIGDIL